MKAYVYHGPDQKGAWEEVPNPTILEPTDVIAADFRDLHEDCSPLRQYRERWRARQAG